MSSELGTFTRTLTPQQAGRQLMNSNHDRFMLPFRLRDLYRTMIPFLGIGYCGLSS
jgi:hypothetical protein